MKQALKRKEEPSYMGTFTSARRHVLHTFANTESALSKRRVAQYMLSIECPVCHGKRLRQESLSVKFAGLDIAEMSRQPLERLGKIMHPYVDGSARTTAKLKKEHPEKSGGGAADRRRSLRQAHGSAGPGARVSHAGAKHAHAFAGRTATPPIGNASTLQFVWRSLCAR